MTVGVDQDASSRVYVPSSVGQWSTLLTGTGLNAPTSIWLAQESASTLTDYGTAGRTVTVNGSPTYRATAQGWSRVGLKPPDASATAYGTCTIPDVSTTSCMLLQMFSLNTIPSGTRALNRVGAVTAETASLTSGNKLLATSNANTATGSQTQAGVCIVITKLDRANSVFGVYSKREQIKATYSAPGASTTLYLFGNATSAVDATLVYAALWTGADAEISDANVQKILDAVVGGETTLEKLQAGSLAMKWCVTVEGCPYAFTDAPIAAAATAYADTDWSATTNWLGNLFVELNNDQSITPLQPFTNTGDCTLRIVDDGTDTIGKFIAKRQGGRETSITSSIGCNDTTIPVRSTTTWASSGTAYIGTEAINYTGITGTSLTGCTRGMYSPFRADTSGSAGNRIGNPHRVGTDINHVQMNPVVSTIPRTWINKKIAVRLHTWDAVNQTINSRAQAQLVFAGRITGISEDKEVIGTTVIRATHLMHDLQDATLWKDQFVAELKPGVVLRAGRVFQFKERVTGFPTANVLTVVSGAPASVNEVQEGTYSLTNLCHVINAWLGSEKAAARIQGNYTLASPVSNSDGIRTNMYWINSTTADSYAGFYLTLPWEVAQFLGFEGDPADGGASVRWPAGLSGIAGRKGENVTTSGTKAPFDTMIFQPLAGQLGADFASSTWIDADNCNGTYVDQYAVLPASIKALCSPSATWGVFLFDEKVLVVATYDSSIQRFKNCWVTTIMQLTGSNSTAGSACFGRRADEADRGPVKIRQIILIEDTWAQALLSLLYTTGTAGYNHSTYDNYPLSVGVALPGELIGDEFKTTVMNMTGANAPVMIVLDEPTKFADIVAGDLNFRLAFIRWKDQHFEIKQWRTPLNTNAIATLTESNKAVPAGDAAPNFRVASEETNEHVRSVIKIDYCRDFAIGRNGDYLRSFMFEDQTAVDDAGGGVKPTTIQLRNTIQQHANAGSSIEAGLPDFMARMPSISRASHKIRRSMDHRYFESIAPGDIVTVVDAFARDPLTGVRGVSSRAFFATATNYDFGGPSGTPGSKPRDAGGEVTCNSLDTQRGRAYAPSADIDSTFGSGGYTAGYNAATKTMRCVAHSYSHAITVSTSRGAVYIDEAHDATYFPTGSKVRVVERDPSNVAAPLTWTDIVASQAGDDITLTTGLGAYDTSKRYRIMPDNYSTVVTAQKDVAYQALSTNELVSSTDIPWHYSTTDEQYGYSNNTSPGTAEFVASNSYGDGVPLDVGSEKAIWSTIDAFIDRKSAHQAPFLNTQIMGPSDVTSTTWATLFFGPIFLGTSLSSQTVSRVLTVAPWFRSDTGGSSASLRITIVDQPPAMATNPGFLPGECYRDSIITGRYSRSATYTTTSATWQQGADATLDLSAKEVFFGFTWVLVEGTGHIQTRGLAKVVEGPRVVS